MTRAVVSAGEGFERAGDGVGQHEDEGGHPGGGDDLGGVGLGLPHPGFQRVANGAVALQGDGHQVEGGNTHRDAWRSKEKTGMEEEWTDVTDGALIKTTEQKGKEPKAEQS